MSDRRSEATRLIGTLSPRELEVLELMADGHTYVVAAYALGLSRATVSNHLTSIRHKLDVGSTTAAAVMLERSRS